MKATAVARKHRAFPEGFGELRQVAHGIGIHIHKHKTRPVRFRCCPLLFYVYKCRHRANGGGSTALTRSKGSGRQRRPERMGRDCSGDRIQGGGSRASSRWVDSVDPSEGVGSTASTRSKTRNRRNLETIDAPFHLTVPPRPQKESETQFPRVKHECHCSSRETPCISR